MENAQPQTPFCMQILRLEYVFVRYILADGRMVCVCVVLLWDNLSYLNLPSEPCFIIMCFRFTNTIAPNDIIMMANIEPSNTMNQVSVRKSSIWSWFIGYLQMKVKRTQAKCKQLIIFIFFSMIYYECGVCVFFFLLRETVECAIGIH